MNAFLISPATAGSGSYSPPVTTFLGSVDTAGMRNALGLGTADSPTFLGLSLTGQSLTGTQATSLVDLNATWNTIGTPTAIKLNVTNTNSNPAALLVDLQRDLVSQFKVDKFGAMILGPSITTDWVGSGMRIGNRYDAITLQNGSALLNMSTSGQVNVGGALASYALAGNTILATDGTGILAQRNGTNAQAFRVYNTDPVVGAKEWFEINWQPTGTNSVKIGTAHAGTGGSRALEFATSNTGRWQVSGGSGHFLASTDSTYDIGASGANRPRTLYLGGNLNMPTNGIIVNGTRGFITVPADGVVQFLNNAQTGFTRLELGEANMGIMRGAGTPENIVTAKVGSIYLRTDGTSGSSFYVKESGSGANGWVGK